MKFAIVEGKRREAEPGLSAICAGCSNAMVAKCGDLNCSGYSTMSLQETIAVNFPHTAKH
ncbi:MAG: hypothetical protein JSR24_00185 [Proteobacteria bacterium]|nr:hypothetical protein [Pseudomonadota bacterium]